MKTATATAPTFTEEQIQTKMQENDYHNYLTLPTYNVDDTDILNWMIEHTKFSERAQDYLDAMIEELRNEAIAELTEEITPESVKRQRRIDDINERIAGLQAELATL